MQIPFLTHSSWCLSARLNVPRGSFNVGNAERVETRINAPNVIGSLQPQNALDFDFSLIESLQPQNAGDFDFSLGEKTLQTIQPREMEDD